MDRLSPLDASFLHLEDDRSHMHIGSVAIFEGPPAAKTALHHARDTPLAPPATSGLGPGERRVVVREVRDASVHGFQLGMGIGAALVLLGGVLGAFGIRNPKRDVECRRCPGGQLAGVPEVVAQPARAAA